MRKIYSWRIFETLMYDVDWHGLLPQTMVVVKDGVHEFKLGNIMKHSDMVQVTYENKKDEWGVPETLEFDFYFIQNGHMRIDVDVTWGDAMACEFYVEAPSKIGVIQYTSYGSKTDPSNTVFALDDDCLSGLVSFINKFEGFNLSVGQFSFLDKRDNFDPSTIG
jgi:hypothetical protein